MKLITLALLAASCGFAPAAVILQVKVSNVVDFSGNPLVGNTPVLILVDLDDAGVPAILNPEESVTFGSILTAPGSGSRYFVAELGFTRDEFFGSQLDVVSRPIDLDTTPVATGQSYYAAWFPDRPGTDPTQITPGEFFEALNSSQWIVPGNAGSNVGLDVVSANVAIIGLVVPEPAGMLLLGLAGLGTLRRRR